MLPFFMELFKPKGKVKIDRVFLNKKNGQLTVVLPKKKLKSIPTRVEITYW